MSPIRIQCQDSLTQIVHNVHNRCQLAIDNTILISNFLQNGQTALAIAQKLGYISVVETLKIVTETIITTTHTVTIEEKYRVQAPESMQETFMSDSEDEGGKFLPSLFREFIITNVLKVFIFLDVTIQLLIVKFIPLSLYSRDRDFIASKKLSLVNFNFTRPARSSSTKKCPSRIYSVDHVTILLKYILFFFCRKVSTSTPVFSNPRCSLRMTNLLIARLKLSTVYSYN